MIRTFLTQEWGLRYPIIGAPMGGASGGALAGAISEAGGLGLIGVGPVTGEWVTREAAVAGAAGRRYGIGLLGWMLEPRPELLEAAIATKPFLLSVSFPLDAQVARRIKSAGVKLTTQVSTAAQAREAAALGVDLIVAQGTEAGGHSSDVAVGTMVAMQSILDAVKTPVVMAGGIASARGLAAVIAAGAEGAWIGSAFLTSPESTFDDQQKERIIAADETSTFLSVVFDRARKSPWPGHYPGRALRNRFSDRWHGKEDELDRDAQALAEFASATQAREYDVAQVWVGQAAGLIRNRAPAGDIVRDLGEGAEVTLRTRLGVVLHR